MTLYIERSCTTTVDRILNGPRHPLTKPQLPQPKHYTRNSQIRITKAKTVAYENSCLQIVLRMKRVGYRNKYTKPRRKEATTEEYHLEVQKRKKQSRSQPSKMLQKGNIDLSTQQDKNELICPTSKRPFKKIGINQHITNMHKIQQKKQITQAITNLFFPN